MCYTNKFDFSWLYLTCFLWTWRRLTAMSPEGFSGVCCWRFGVLESLFRTIRSKSCFCIFCTKSNSFMMRVGLCQGCPLLTILFVIFMNRIPRRSQGEEDVWFGNIRVTSLLFMDDVVLLASSSHDIQSAPKRVCIFIWSSQNESQPFILTYLYVSFCSSAADSWCWSQI